MNKSCYFVPATWSLITAMAIGTAGCRRDVPEAANASGSKSSSSDKLTQTLYATDWSNQWNDLSKQAFQLEGQMVQDQLKPLLNSSSFSSPFEDLKKALEAGDHVKVEILARKLDELLGSQDALTTAFAVLKVHQQKGAEAARRFVDDYALREDLTVFQKEAVQQLREAQAAIANTDFRPYIALAIVFACASKFGPHEGAALGGLVVQALFPEMSHAESRPILPRSAK